MRLTDEVREVALGIHQDLPACLEAATLPDGWSIETAPGYSSGLVVTDGELVVRLSGHRPLGHGGWVSQFSRNTVIEVTAVHPYSLCLRSVPRRKVVECRSRKIDPDKLSKSIAGAIKALDKYMGAYEQIQRTEVSESRKEADRIARTAEMQLLAGEACSVKLEKSGAVTVTVTTDEDGFPALLQAIKGWGCPR